MPVYDLRCAHGHERLDVFCTYAESQAPCPLCGGEVEQMVWKGTPSVQADSVPGGFIVENGFREPRKFYSKSDHLRALDAKGLRLKPFEHVPVPGSDKSPISTNWAAVAPGTLAGAAALVERVTGGPSTAESVKVVQTKHGAVYEPVVAEAPVPITVTEGATFRFAPKS